jgi:RNA-directed DNA polymerase
MRNLGIPVVMDRVVSPSTNLVFQEIFEPDFIRSNYGFRRGHSQRQVTYHAKAIMKKGYEWCVSIDLARFFDAILHDLFLKLIRRKIPEKQMVILMERALKVWIVIDRKLEKSAKGCCRVNVSSLSRNDLPG